MSSERDRRQISLIKESLNRFAYNREGLGLLVRDVEALLQALEEIPMEWIASAREHWWDLEQVYAVVLDRNDDSIIRENQELIRSAITELKRLVQRHIC